MSIKCDNESYEAVLQNNPKATDIVAPSVKETSNSVSTFVNVVKDVIIGAGHSMDSNMLYGTAFSIKGINDRDLPKSKAYKVGSLVGDVASLIGGGAQAAAGGGGEVFGFALDGTVVLSPAGAAVNIASAAVVVNGANTMRRSVDNLANDLVSFASDGEGESKTYQTYIKTNTETGKVYSGRTSGTNSPLENIANRDAKHHMNDEGFGPAKLDKSSSNMDAIRGREQQLIDQNGGAKSQGGTLGNSINGISNKNPLRKKYLDEAEKEFNK